MQRIYQKDLADAAGVSVSQVSRALNGKADVAPEVRQRIQKLARQMNYRNLSCQHPVTLAVLIGWMNDYTSNLFNALCREAERDGIRLAVVLPRYLSILDGWLFDGVISISNSSLIPGWHAQHQLPLVVLNSLGNPLDQISGVFSDGGFSLAMEYLISLGHRRIAVGNPGTEHRTRDGKRGVTAFRSIVEKWEIEACHFHYHGWEELDARLCQLFNENYTAFLDVSNENGPRLLKFLRDKKKEVPKDFSLITYDNVAVSPYLDPPLTTLAYDFQGMARSAIKLMRLRLKNSTTVNSIRFQTKLILRSSTGPVPSR